MPLSDLPITQFIALVDRARTDHGGIGPTITMTDGDWSTLKNALIATGATAGLAALPGPGLAPRLSRHYPDAVGAVLGIPILIGPRTSFPCLDGTELTP